MLFELKNLCVLIFLLLFLRMVFFFICNLLVVRFAVTFDDIKHNEMYF